MAQQPVADGVAIEVVDLLEAVQVQGEQGQGLSRLDRVGLTGQAAQEGGAVGQAGQAVVAGQVGDAALLGLTGAQVAHGVEHDLALAGVVALGRQFDRQDLARCGGQRRLHHVAVGQPGGVLGPARQALAQHGLALGVDQLQQGAVQGDDGPVALNRHAVHAALDQMLQTDLGLTARLAVQRIAGRAGAQDQQADASDADGDGVLGVIARQRPVQRRERQDGQGRHGGEVQDDDAQNHAGDGQPASARVRRAVRQMEGQAAEQQGADHSGDDIGAGPLDHRVHGEGGHADKVHQGDAQAEHQAAQDGGGAQALRGQQQGRARTGDGHQQR
uniref:PE-PGRS family protein n=1 Tax=Parastrongyloides trichosuri TaxID=131310 RepID=A0A0N4ZXW9_PARTI